MKKKTLILCSYAAIAAFGAVGTYGALTGDQIAQRRAKNRSFNNSMEKKAKTYSTNMITYHSEKNPKKRSAALKKALKAKTAMAKQRVSHWKSMKKLRTAQKKSSRSKVMAFFKGLIGGAGSSRSTASTGDGSSAPTVQYQKKGPTLDGSGIERKQAFPGAKK